ncbi:SPW repeat protein [Rhodococcoides yunnanense]|uniref:SPW repeat protein n=1 Tax=Rhodococcoides yunnanense TaxID=278209 RepID=UPI00093465AC|nr:SPW repeat protein [Rhodococcus yunnanensis]
MSTSTNLPIHTHPDIAALRDHYDEAFGRPTAQVTDGLLLLAGLYAAASSWIVGFGGFDNGPAFIAAADGATAITVSNLMCGLAIAILALAFGAAYGRTHGVSFVVPLLGLWLIVSPWIIADVVTTTSMIWSNVVVGVVVLILGSVTTAMGTPAMDRNRLKDMRHPREE